MKVQRLQLKCWSRCENVNGTLSEAYVHIQDCTKLTASGYAGSDVEDCLVGLLRSTNYNVKKAEQGIVVLDEMGKNRPPVNGCISFPRCVWGMRTARSPQNNRGL